MDSPLIITPAAVAAIRERVAKGPAGTRALRLQVKSTGCSGNSYHMDYVDSALSEAQADDVFEVEGASLYIPKTQSWMLFGTTIDYTSDDLGNESFVFRNPNEAARCGCGESFQIKKKDADLS